MSSFIQAANPTAPITTEAEARAAARSSAIAIIIGVLYGLVGIAITLTTMGALKAAAAASVAANGGTIDSAGIASSAISFGIWTGVGFVVLQAILAFVQWRRPNKIIAIIFLLLIALGAVGTLLSVMALSSGALPQGTPAAPIWQIALAMVVYVIEAVLHFAGLRGINKLDKMQMDAAR